MFVPIIRYSDKINLGEKGIIFAYSSRLSPSEVYHLTVGNHSSWGLNQIVTSHPNSKSREKQVHEGLVLS